MIIVGSCVGDGGAKFRSLTRPSLEGCLSSDDLVVTQSGSKGICAAYNAIIEVARARPDCELVVLLHDDVEVLDANFRAKLLLGASMKRAAVLGVVGGSGLRTLQWWSAKDTAGALFETRGFMDLGARHAEVDCVDGLLMALTPRAFRSLTFDEIAFPQFHGYDVDICLQARAAGLSNFVLPIDVIHRTKGGYGDDSAFAAAATSLLSKWPQFLRPEPMWRVAFSRTKARTGGVAAGVARRVRRYGRRAVPHHGDSRAAGGSGLRRAPAPQFLVCPVCDGSFKPNTEGLARIPVLECPVCGLGITWPPPSRDVETAALWQNMYGGARLRRRKIWFGEAQCRVDWVKLFTPEGMLLELGSGTGEFLATANRNGYESYGIEPSKWAAERARELGVDVVTGYLQDWSNQHPGIRPDAVALWHVLEHVPRPSVLLRDIRELLAPGGRLFLEVPNYASINARLLGRRWEGLQPDDHFNQFSPRSMRHLLERRAFEVEQLLEISPRIYHTSDGWSKAKNAALVEGRPWPSLDYLRVSAIAQ